MVVGWRPPGRSEDMSVFECMECGRKFRTVKAAERAASKGCSGCGSVDIDLAETDVLTRDAKRHLDEQIRAGREGRHPTFAEEREMAPPDGHVECPGGGGGGGA